ncbi:hypothetical protein EYF80_050444 [Liparis tanakae]|uniref:Uncharacterized protein n=1 Tax=Liparis tanakae TaxID=230148 RepID=A0A4Z2FDS3_9TELE|nr:hypothetical protein EYF80_050444 [Liparis tanakae]
MSQDKLEGLVKRMEETLSEMERLKAHCGKQSEELSQLVVELRRENQELVEKYDRLTVEMKEAREVIAQLMDTKHAFDAKERQAQKLRLCRTFQTSKSKLPERSQLSVGPAPGRTSGSSDSTDTAVKAAKHVFKVCDDVIVSAARGQEICYGPQHGTLMFLTVSN